MSRSAVFWDRPIIRWALAAAVLVMVPQWISIIIRPVQPFDHLASFLDAYVPARDFLVPSSLRGTLAYNFSYEAWLFRPFSASYFHGLLIVFGSEYWVQYLIKIVFTMAIAVLSGKLVFRLTESPAAAAVSMVVCLLHPAPSNLMYYAPEVFATLATILCIYLLTLIWKRAEISKSADDVRTQLRAREKDSVILTGLLLTTIASVGLKEWGVVVGGGVIAYLILLGLAGRIRFWKASYVAVTTCILLAVCYALTRLVRSDSAAAFSGLEFSSRLLENLKYSLPIQLNAALGPFAAFVFVLSIGIAIVAPMFRSRSEAATAGVRAMRMLLSPVLFISALAVVIIVFNSIPAKYPPRTTPRYVYPAAILLTISASIGLGTVCRLAMSAGALRSVLGQVGGALFVLFLIAGMPAVSYTRTTEFNLYIDRFNSYLNAAIAFGKGSRVYYFGNDDTINQEVEGTIRAFSTDRGRAIFGIEPGTLSELDRQKVATEEAFYVISSQPTQDVLAKLRLDETHVVTAIYASVASRTHRDGMPRVTRSFVHIAKWLGTYARPYWESGTTRDESDIWFQIYRLCRREDAGCRELPRHRLFDPGSLIGRREGNEVNFGHASVTSLTGYGQIMSANSAHGPRVRMRLRDSAGMTMWEGYCQLGGECRLSSPTLDLPTFREYRLELFLYANETADRDNVNIDAVDLVPIIPLVPERRFGGFVGG